MAKEKISQELPEERLATLAEDGRRVKLYPADVTGHYRNIRKVFHEVLMLVFLVLPWIKINGYQAVLFDIPNRRFAIFGLTFWAHDAPMLFLVFAAIAIAVALVTAIWGRLWCGWACPETVFTESVYRRIERWVEGAHQKRRKLDQGPWDSNKIWRKSLKWFLFVVVTLVITHSFLAYFVGVDQLAEMIQSSPSKNPTAFSIMLFTSAVLLFAFGWFREQFCVIMCPYGRFQSLLMDEDSLAIVYDEKRGEPRRGEVPEGGVQGDCINCYKCVQACPTGVDIRRGVQMECIACTACIDACDFVMEQTKRPKGLIRYDTAKGLRSEANTHIRLRTVLYSSILILVLSVLGYVLADRPPIDITLLRAKGSPYQQASNDSGEPLVINHFRLAVSNYQFEPAKVYLTIHQEGKDTIKESAEIVMALKEVPVNAGEDKKLDFFVRYPKSVLKNGVAHLNVLIHAQFENREKEYTRVESIEVVGPFK